MSRVLIIDVGIANIHSISNAVLNIVGKENMLVASDISDQDSYDKIIFPGVGSFDQAMNNLNKREGLVKKMREEVFNKKIPFLGICVGLQVMASIGFENQETEGLDWVKGEVIEFKGENLRVPHMAWNNIKVSENAPEFFKEFQGQDFYFVHSYYLKLKEKQDLVATAQYGDIVFPAIIQKDNIIATQFHPEKSGDNGMGFLKKFLTL